MRQARHTYMLSDDCWRGFLASHAPKEPISLRSARYFSLHPQGTSRKITSASAIVSMDLSPTHEHKSIIVHIKRESNIPANSRHAMMPMECSICPNYGTLTILLPPIIPPCTHRLVHRVYFKLSLEISSSYCLVLILLQLNSVTAT